MSLERVIKALVSLGLTKLDAEVYVFLAKKAPLKSIDIAQKLKIQNKQVCSSLKSLQNKGIVKTRKKQFEEFIAIPFAEALNFLIKINRDQAESVCETRKELVSSWNKMVKSSENN